MLALFNGEYLEAYATTGELKDGIEIDVTPEEINPEKAAFYRRTEDNKLIFDEEKYNAFLEEEQNLKLDVLKNSLIIQSKKNLEKYLQEHTVYSKCHGDIEKQYSITAEKQQHLTSMILKAQGAAQIGLEYQPSWNAAGEERTNDWTISELQQLAIEIEAVVRPLVTAQQKAEVAIKKASTIEELEGIYISFGEGVQEA